MNKPAIKIISDDGKYIVVLDAERQAWAFKKKKAKAVVPILVNDKVVYKRRKRK